MRWTKPSTDPEKSFYSRFAGALKNYQATQWFTQYLVWLPIAAFAITEMIIQPLHQFIQVPFVAIFLIMLLVTYNLHRLLNGEYTAYWYDRLDDNPQTNSTIYFTLLLGGFLALMEYGATAKYLQNQIPIPEIASTESAESWFSNKLNEIDSRYEKDKLRLEENFSSRFEAVSPALLKEMRKWDNMKPNDWKDLQYVRRMRKNATDQFYNQHSVKELVASHESALQQLQTSYNNELQLLQSERDQKKGQIISNNTKTDTEYQLKMKMANGLSGLFSIVCFAIFLWCGYKKVYIKAKSGIFPVREFTDMDTYGGNLEKSKLVLSDIFNRYIHHRLFRMHRKSSQTIGTLYGIDGRVIMADGNYQVFHPGTSHPVNGRKVLEHLGKN